MSKESKRKVRKSSWSATCGRRILSPESERAREGGETREGVGTDWPRVKARRPLLQAASTRGLAHSPL
eukprot:3275291-Amphidinium_carterae.1